MSLADDLLEQAEHLVARDATRPKQASLRRAISAAYYALFHLLVREGSSRLVTGNDLRGLTARAFAHGDTKEACKPFAAGSLPAHLLAVVGSAVPQDLKLVADNFIRLQGERHEADYNVRRVFTRPEAKRLTHTAREAFHAWDRVKNEPIVQVFLVALLLHSRWDRNRR